MAEPTATVGETLIPGRWQARLTLRLAKRFNGCRLVGKEHCGPLYVQRPFYPEGQDLAHLYLLHPPGGLVSGDRLEVDVHLAEGAQTLLTTPGAGRVYRARADGALQSQYNRILLADGASCEWFPQENIIFNGARTTLETRFDLEGNGHFISWEITVLGLPARQEDFIAGEVQQRLLVNRDGLPLLVEHLLLHTTRQQLLHSVVGLRSRAVNGLLVAGPLPETLDREGLLSELRSVEVPGANHCDWALTITGEFMTARYLGNCAEQAKQLFTALWHNIRPALLGREACPPRIWAT